MTIVSKALTLITIGTAIAALVLLVVELSPTGFPADYDNMAWFRLPAAGILGLAAAALYLGSLLRRRQAASARWLGAGLIVAGLMPVALIVALLAALAALVIAWGNGP
jgi:hypothetical protein